MPLFGLALAVLVGVSLGLLGGGGSILTVPLLVHVFHLDPKEAIATSLVVVGVTSAAALVGHARAGNVSWRTGAIFGGAGMVGAWLGGTAAGWLSGRVLLLLFAGMMVATAVAMLRPSRAVAPAGTAPEAPARHGHPTVRILLDGLIVGAVTGLVGAGGGFLVVPALALLGGLPMQRAIGTSLLVIAMKSAAGFAGHASHVTIDPQLAAVVSLAAVLGSVAGGTLARKVQPEQLRRGFAVFVLVMAVVQVGLELRGGLA